jgi:acetoin utilization protein AcuB
MPGFMGLRGLELKDTREIVLHKREGLNRTAVERRAVEKADQALHDRVGSPSARPGGTQSAADAKWGGDIEVGAIMSGRVAVLTFDDTILTALNIFSRVKIHHLPIVDGDGGIIGVISDRDVLRNSSPFYGTINEQNRDKEIMTRRVGMIMSRNPHCVNADTPVLEAVRLMNAKHISCLPIVDQDSRRLLGIVTWKDVVHAICPAGFDANHDSTRLRIIKTLKPTAEEGGTLHAAPAGFETSDSTRRFVHPPDAGASPAGESGRPAQRPHGNPSGHGKA